MLTDYLWEVRSPLTRPVHLTWGYIKPTSLIEAVERHTLEKIIIILGAMTSSSSLISNDKGNNKIKIICEKE